jgi:hypothetical protein
MDEIFNPNNSNFLTAIATVLLVLVGLIQIFVLFSQRKQTRIALTEQYRQLWNSLNNYWGNFIFSETNDIITGDNLIKVSDLNLNDGLYYLSINSESFRYTDKIVCVK